MFAQFSFRIIFVRLFSCKITTQTIASYRDYLFMKRARFLFKGKLGRKSSPTFVSSLKVSIKLAPFLSKLLKSKEKSSKRTAVEQRMLVAV